MNEESMSELMSDEWMSALNLEGAGQAALWNAEGIV